MAEFNRLVAGILSARDKKTYCCVHSFGCQQNVSDGEKILGVLESMGYKATDNENDAELIIFNTCAVRENAEQRIYGLLGELKKLKEDKPQLIIGVCGCMAQEEKNVEKIKRTYRQVDLVFGTHAIGELPRLLYEVMTERKFSADISQYDVSCSELEPVRNSTFKANVPIMYGCDNFCSYCIVPYVRGRERSRRSEDILEEIKALADKGYKEIMLLGQNVNSYGKGLYEKIDFAELLRKIDDIDGDFKVRFMSPHPKDVTRELLDTIVHSRKICRHLHLPLQSGSNAVLERMNRRYTVEKYLETVDYARSLIPDFSITTDIIVGFPNETDEDFQATLDVVKKVEFDNIFSFIYSKRTGTKAAEMEDFVSDVQKSKRMTELLHVQREISTHHYRRFLGKTLDVLFDGRHKNLLSGKSDEFIIVEAQDCDEFIGQRKKVLITEAYNWALKGDIIN